MEQEALAQTASEKERSTGSLAENKWPGKAVCVSSRPENPFYSPRTPGSLIALARGVLPQVAEISKSRYLRTETLFPY